MKTIRFILLALIAIVLSVSCIHQFPDENTPARVDVTLTFNTEMPYFRTLRYPEETMAERVFEDDPENKPQYFDAILPDWHTDVEKYRIRYVAEAYRVLSSGRVAQTPEQRYVGYDNDASQWDDYTFSMYLKEGTYEIRVWADYILADSENDLYYNVAKFSGITINHQDGIHHGNTDYRDAHVGRARFENIRYGVNVEPVQAYVNMYRPMGKYVFVTTDLEEFATKVLLNKYGRYDESLPASKAPEFNIEDYTLIIRCYQYLPTSFSMETDQANNSKVNVQFESTLKPIDDHHAIMGFDYVLASGNDKTTKVALEIILQDKDKTVLASNKNVFVHLKRNKMTLVEGSFLMQDSDGGVSINPGFNGPDIIVPVY